MHNLIQDDANIDVWLILDNSEYELSDFKISFSQACDEKGEPQSIVRGGRMNLSFKQSLPESIYNWAVKTSLKKSGSVEFRLQSQSAPLKVEFMDAYCINFDRNVDSIGGGLTTSLIISPEEILINEFSFDNKWNN